MAAAAATQTEVLQQISRPRVLGQIGWTGSESYDNVFEFSSVRPNTGLTIRYKCCGHGGPRSHGKLHVTSHGKTVSTPYLLGGTMDSKHQRAPVRGVTDAVAESETPVIGDFKQGGPVQVRFQYENGDHGVVLWDVTIVATLPELPSGSGPTNEMRFSSTKPNQAAFTGARRIDAIFAFVGLPAATSGVLRYKCCGHGGRDSRGVIRVRKPGLYFETPYVLGGEVDNTHNIIHQEGTATETQTCEVAFPLNMLQRAGDLEVEFWYNSGSHGAMVWDVEIVVQMSAEPPAYQESPAAAPPVGKAW